MTEKFQIGPAQAQVYEDSFVPALFAQWAPQLVACARLQPGQRVLDVACGTGIVARTADDVVRPGGHVTGVDLNPAMLEVARRTRPDLEWCEGDVEDLPFQTASFDAALCQSALFFFPDPARAVKEMARVVRVGGTVALQTYAPLDDQPGYGPFVEAVAARAGAEAAVLLGTYWSHGDLGKLAALLEGAGLEVLETRTSLGSALFPSAQAVAEIEIGATPLGDRLDAETYEQILADTREQMGQYADDTGAVHVPVRAVMVAARRS
jgi:SAM-dependent methyltransferase